MLSDTGFKAGHGKRWGVPATEIGALRPGRGLGHQPGHTHVNLMTHIARARKERGAKLVVVDPYRSATAEQRRHAPGPASGHRRRAGLRRHARPVQGRPGRPRLSRPLQRRARRARSGTCAPARRAWASAITGLPEAEILAFARLYGGTKRAFLRLGYGFTRSRNGAAAMHAASCLPVVTGAWQHRGRRRALQFRRPLPLGQDD